MKVKEFIKLLKYAEDHLFDVYKNERFVLIGADVNELLDLYGDEVIPINSVIISGNIEIDL